MGKNTTPKVTKNKLALTVLEALRIAISKINKPVVKK